MARPRRRPRHPLKAIAHRAESLVAGFGLAAMAILPLAEILARELRGGGLPGAGPITQHLTLWVGFLGAAIAAREGKLLSLATTTFIAPGKLRTAAEIFAAAVGAAVSTLLCRAGIDLVLVERTSGQTVALGIPVWAAELVLPLSFGLIALRLVWRSSRGWGRAMAAIGIVAGAWIGQFPGMLEAAPRWPGLLVIALATLLGCPIFVTLGGAAVLLFLGNGVPASAIPAETYRLAVSPSLAAIPLFTLTGFLLAEGKASERLLRVFRALFGWIPGGTAVVCTLVCAFFTAFTGGSGVTILALGGLLLPALIKDGYRERFSLGLLTSAGSLGLLFPPSLPLILYGIVAQTPIKELFLGGLIPGLALVGLVAAWGVREGLRTGAGRAPFHVPEALAALWAAKWELALPAVVLAAIFSGFATLVEASALTALYAFVIQKFVQRDLSFRHDLPRVLGRSVVLVGGVLVILGAAMGFSSFMVDAQVPAHLLDWTRGNIGSPLVFLLILNVFLIIVGCLLDIFSATIVVVPLIVPLGVAFGIHPVHLGIIFVANLELGYLTPPVGMNLFLASYRFERPLLEVYRASVPMLLIRAAGVLLVTYIPPLTTGLLRLAG